MLATIGVFVLLAAVIFAAGASLTWYADQIALITGFGRLLVGSVLLAGATSLPELAVDITAVRIGQPDIAAGDLRSVMADSGISPTFCSDWLSGR